jgi:hypothetical protein
MFGIRVSMFKIRAVHRNFAEATVYRMQFLENYGELRNSDISTVVPNIDLVRKPKKIKI